MALGHGALTGLPPALDVLRALLCPQSSSISTLSLWPDSTNRIAD